MHDQNAVGKVEICKEFTDHVFAFNPARISEQMPEPHDQTKHLGSSTKKQDEEHVP